jgi:hypothetical protein
MLAGTVLEWIGSINNLGVIIDKKMNFSEHEDVMVGKAFAMLGLIRRLSFELRDPYSIHSEVSIHRGSSEAVKRQLCMEPIL